MTFDTGEKKFLQRTFVVSAAFLGMLAFAGASRASAESYDGCQRRIAKADQETARSRGASRLGQQTSGSCAA